MGFLKKIPLFLFLLPLFFCLHNSVEYFGFVSTWDVIKLFVIISAALVLLFFVIRYFTKSTLFSALITFYIGVWNLFFGTLHHWMKSTPFLSWLSSYTVLVPLLFTSIIILVIVLKKHKAFQHKLQYYFNILILIYCVYEIALLSIRSFNSEKLPTEQVPFDHSKVTTKPNVYCLVFDGYPGYKSLDDYFGFKNDSLYHFFTRKGFKILPTQSNYNLTYFSMEAVFNMEYVRNNFNPDSITQLDYLRRIKGIKNAQVFSIFSSMGYSIQNLSIFDIHDHKKFSNNTNVISGPDLFTHNIFYSKFFREVGWVLLTGKYEVPFLDNFFLKKITFNNRVEDALYKSFYTKTSGPKFLYAHYFLPHEPIYFDSVGNKLPDEIVSNKNTVRDKKYYLGYLKYTNKRMVSMINEIIKKDPGALIIIMSDHGYKFYDVDALIPYHFDNICAVRFARSGCIQQETIFSNVNIFRYIFNCIYNQRLPYVNDSNFFLTQ